MDPRTSKENKALGQYGEDEFRSMHPCSYVILDLPRVGDTGTQVYKILKYAVENDMTYMQAMKKAPDARGSDVHNNRVAKRLNNLDVDATGRGRKLDNLATPKDELNALWVKLASERDSGSDSYWALIHRIADEIATLDTEDALDIIEEDDRQTGDSAEDNTREESDFDQGEDADMSDDSDSSIIQTRDVWGSDNDFVAWMYAKLVGRDDVADRITQGSNVDQLSTGQDIQRSIDISVEPSDLERNVANNNNIEFTPEQKAKWSQARELGSNYSSDNEALVNVVNEMSRLDMVVGDDPSSEENSTIIDPGVDDDGQIPDYEFDPSDSPEDLPSILEAEMRS